MDEIDQLSQKYSNPEPQVQKQTFIETCWRQYPIVIALHEAVKAADGIHIRNNSGAPSLVYDPPLDISDPARWETALEVSGLYEAAATDLQRCMDHGLIKLKPHPMPKENRRVLPSTYPPNGFGQLDWFGC